MNDFPVIEIDSHISPPYFYGAFEDSQNIPDLGYPKGFESNQWMITALVYLFHIQQHNLFEGHLRPFCGIIYDKLMKRKKLRLLDFGGGIGDNYIQIKREIPGHLFKGIQYSIIDNADSVKIGKSLHKDVSFFTTIEQAMQEGLSYDIALFSGVLMYIENSPSLIKYIKDSFKCDIFITRTLFTEKSNTFTTIQYISPDCGPSINKFIGIEKSTICNLETFKKDAGISPDQIMISYGYQPYKSALQNLPLAYQDAGYYALYITDDNSCIHNNRWYRSTGKSWTGEPGRTERFLRKHMPVIHKFLKMS
jgi:putative methyltransferase (TIGR04325 family)